MTNGWKARSRDIKPVYIKPVKSEGRLVELYTGAESVGHIETGRVVRGKGELSAQVGAAHKEGYSRTFANLGFTLSHYSHSPNSKQILSVR